VNQYREAFLSGLAPEHPLTIDEWSERHMYLSTKSSAEPGRFRVDRTPYIREPMRELSNSCRTERVVLMFAAQTGKTNLGLCFMAWTADHSPAPLMACQPTIQMAQRLSKQRLEQMIEDCPQLQKRIKPARSRDSGNTAFQKDFPGGTWILTGSNSPTGLRSAPIARLFADEVDAYPQETGEGDALDLAEKRTTTFSRRKILITSTPTLKGFSRVEKEFELSDKRFFHIKCPHCGASQHLRWPQLKWEKDKPETAAYECERCGERFDERQKSKLLREGEWKATAPFDGKTAGFHLNGLYSPWFTWPEMVEDFLKCKRDAQRLQVFINTRLSETFSPDYVAQLTVDSLLSRKENYKQGQVPEPVVMLVWGVDCQKDRLEASLWGVAPPIAGGKNECLYNITHEVIWGDPHQPDVWQKLDYLLKAEWPKATGKKLKAVAAAIDSGGLHTSETYDFTRTRRARQVIAIKGQSQKGKPPIGKPTKVDYNWRGQQLKKGGLVYPMGPDTIKNLLLGRLRFGPEADGALHFHEDTTADFFEQLTSESLQIKRSRNGKETAEWVLKPGVRNEVLDCMCMAYAAFYLQFSYHSRAKIWEKFASSEDGLAQPIKARSVASKQGQRPAFTDTW